MSTKSTPVEILDIFNDRQKIINWKPNIDISIERTKGSYKVIAINKETNKSIGRVYIFDIHEYKPGKFKGHLARLHVSDKFRNNGIGRKLLETAINTFSDLHLYGYAVPNRNKEKDDNSKELYRKRLKNFYKSVGLNSVGTGDKVEFN